MAKAANPVPKGYEAVVPHLVVRGAAKALEFYKQAFGAVEVTRSPMPDGRLMHSEIRINNTPVMVNDEFPEFGAMSPQALNGSPVTLHVFVPDVDKAFAQAVAAGAKATMPVMDMFWGDRYGKLEDPFGHHWSLATRKEDLTHEEKQKRGDEAMKMMGKC
jgi:uncharacterized glyoxalase superfamily protein PhnB